MTIKGVLCLFECSVFYLLTVQYFRYPLKKSASLDYFKNLVSIRLQKSSAYFRFSLLLGKAKALQPIGFRAFMVR